MLLEEEAHRANQTKYEFIKSYTPKNFTSALEIELKNNDYEAVLANDSIRAEAIYNTAVYQVSLNGVKSELIDDAKVSVFLKKDFHREFQGNLEGPHIMETGNGCCLEIAVISNYECLHCYTIYDDIKLLADRYKDIAQFKFVYFSDQLLKFAKAPIAADNQNAFDAMNDFVIERVHDGILSDSLILSFAEHLGLNIKDFKEDYNSINVHKQILRNIDVLKDNFIFQTPILIINNRIYDEPNVINILKKILEDKKDEH
ncbi:hypothetical protein DIT68_11705 [Brumimicrobium oceani]|uniref:Thioredoxin-like fold domain-containing protein n=2 Tax=Brumimicrobium oceani TaxID=2100725 RepID=A0A2U2XB47_9FLAO|nr:hypothetical protein DIT68_11705 [Brumimicrobium oceani]